MDLFLIGLSHKTAPVGMRELLAFAEGDLEAALGELRLLEGVREAVLLSTCNRTEVYCVPSAGHDPAKEVVEWLCRRAKADVAPHLYQRHGAEALFHLFRVASSLDSLVLGEPQILGQVKKAFANARKFGGAGPGIDRLFSRAFRVAKRVRSETRVGESGVSVAFIAVELARRVFEDLAGRTVLLVGAGKMCELAAKHLQEAGVTRFFVANRSPERAQALAMRLKGEARTLDDVPSLLGEVDMVLSSTGAPGILVTRAQVAKAVKKRRYRPLFFVDLSVPRDIDPAANELANVYTYDLDDLEKVADENREQRKSEADRAGAIVEEELADLLAERRAREIAPLIASLRRKASFTAEAEVERTWSRLDAMGVPPEGKEALAAMARAMVNKLLHAPTCALKAAASNGDQDELASAAVHLFGLELEPAEETPSPRTGEESSLETRQLLAGADEEPCSEEDVEALDSKRPCADDIDGDDNTSVERIHEARAAVAGDTAGRR